MMIITILIIITIAIISGPPLARSRAGKAPRPKAEMLQNDKHISIIIIIIIIIIIVLVIIYIYIYIYIYRM